MFKFGKKNEEVTEQIMEEITDEQLDQVAGGCLLDNVSVKGLLGTVNSVATPVTHTVTGVVGSVGLGSNNVAVNPTVDVDANGNSISTLLP
ncbi:hypothetical protein [Dictyobacter formicarum]|uniref:Type A2 lantipeptide n=1 Tax=Dictyobacter formicarum TaxID=2778368 RepID=A0ABQ3VAT2_9CHLR|nr:hypothetical protein [Dictyobacter formicarum]GHO83129.1 hypothetical protein KSZ_11350 [Dictyobacter formicarum]